MKKRVLIPVIILSSLLTISGVGVLSCYLAHPNKYRNYCGFYYSLRTTFFDFDNLFAKKGETVFFGDSITEFCDLKTFYPNITSYNRGIAGDTSEGLLGRMQSSVFALNPKQVVLLIGINDITINIGIENISKNVSNICSQIKKTVPNSKVLLQGVYPYTKQYATLIKTLNDSYSVIASNYQYQFLNLYPLLNVDDVLNPEYTTDGLHLNNKGYKIVSEEISKALAE